MIPPAAAWIRAAVLVAAVASPACLVLSLQPVYDDRSVVFDEALLGVWANSEDRTEVTIERGEWRSYRIAFAERGATRVFNGNLTRLGDRRGALFMDLTEVRGVDPGPYLIPVHGIFRIAIEGDVLAAAPLDYDRLAKNAAEPRPAGTPRALDDRRNLILTAPTAELRRWLTRAPVDAFGAPMTFTRAAPGK